MRIEPGEDIFNGGQRTERLTMCKTGIMTLIMVRGMRRVNRRGVHRLPEIPEFSPRCDLTCQTAGEHSRQDVRRRNQGIAAKTAI
jgi:hypothetical protein